MTKGRKSNASTIMNVLHHCLDLQPVPLVAVFVIKEFPENICKILLGDAVVLGTLVSTSSWPHPKPSADMLLGTTKSLWPHPLTLQPQQKQVLLFEYNPGAHEFSLVTGRKRKHYCPQLIASL